ncbi:unnamed protein product, partial [Iphiclides podalirius]
MYVVKRKTVQIHENPPSDEVGGMFARRPPVATAFVTTLLTACVDDDAGAYSRGKRSTDRLSSYRVELHEHGTRSRFTEALMRASRAPMAAEHLATLAPTVASGLSAGRGAPRSTVGQGAVGPYAILIAIDSVT